MESCYKLSLNLYEKLALNLLMNSMNPRYLSVKFRERFFLKNINPIIKEYLSTGEDRDSIIEKYANKNQYLESVLLKLTFEMKLKKGISNDLSKSIDKAIISGHPDPNLFYFFISTVASYYSRNNQLEKAKSICLIISSIKSDEIHPILKANFLQRISAIKFREGHYNESLQVMRESLLLFDKSHPRYYIYSYNSSMFIASLGQLKELGTYHLDEIKYPSDNHKIIMSYQLKILNCIFTCNCLEGINFINESNKNIETTIENDQYISEMFKLLLGDFEDSNFVEPTIQQLAKIYKSISEYEIENANVLFFFFLPDTQPKFFVNQFSNYLPLQFELCLKNTGLAKLLFQEKVKKGEVSYLDDLYVGRIQLLENNLTGADETFARLSENIRRFDARNRLAFELQFAKEMKLPQVLRLLNGWKSDKKDISINLKTELPPKQIKIEKGVNLLIGKSSAISEVKELVKKYAHLKAPVLVTGETGTGKELVSRAIHDEGSYSKEPFLAINCGALTDTLLQSELFGYEAGSFTGALKERIGIFEAAGKGTVFLDEFGDISPKLQVSLLRVLESNEIRLIGGTSTRQIKCKIVIATNVDLKQTVIEKKFREDLFFRLAKFEIKIPALRERLEDIDELIEYFFNLCSYESGKMKSVSNELLQ